MRTVPASVERPGFPHAEITNSMEACGLLVPRGATGIDTLTLSSPIGQWTTAAQAHTRRNRRKHRAYVPLKYGGQITINESGYVSIEASMPTRLFGHNADLVRASALPTLAADMLDEAAEYVDFHIPEKGLLHTRVTRLDITRDFADVDAMQLLFVLLSMIPRPGQCEARVCVNRRGIPTGLIISTESWRVRLYDKRLKTPEADAGTMRYEAQFRPRRMASEWATENGGQIKVLGDIADSKVESLAFGMFRRLNLDVTVSGLSGIIEQIANDCSSSTERVYLVAMTVAEAYGIDLGLSRPTSNKYRTKMRSHGSLLAELKDPSLATPRRLDWSSSRQVSVPTK